MALIGKPTVKSTTAFSVSSELDDSPYIINFTWNGQKCSGNRLTIVETGLSNDIIGLSSTFHELSKTVCDNLGLTNGNTYHATITMLDYEGNPASNPSDQFLLYCYAVPVFTIKNVNNNSTVKSTEFMALLNYYSNAMALSSYKFNLYDATETVLLDSSDELYELPNENTTDYSLCSYTFKGLENNASYYIEAKGVTVYGMELQCSYHITVEINTSSVYSTISADATRDGNVSLNINCIPMGYEYNNISYIDNEEINLTGSDSYVKYTLATPIDDFKFMGKLRGIKNLEEPLISFSDTTSDSKISLIPKIQYVHGTAKGYIPTKLSNNWERGWIYTLGDLRPTDDSNANYIDTTYYDAPESINFENDYGIYFWIMMYDENKVFIDRHYSYLSKEYDTSNAAYVRFAFRNSTELDDEYNNKIRITMNYSMSTEDINALGLIRPQTYQYKNDDIIHTYIDYIESAALVINLYVDNKQYTVNGSSFILDYDNENDLFYLDPNREFLTEITRIDGNYKLIVTESIKEDDLNGSIL